MSIQLFAALLSFVILLLLKLRKNAKKKTLQIPVYLYLIF